MQLFQKRKHSRVFQPLGIIGVPFDLGSDFVPNGLVGLPLFDFTALKNYAVSRDDLHLAGLWTAPRSFCGYGFCR